MSGLKTSIAPLFAVGLALLSAGLTSTSRNRPLVHAADPSTPVVQPAVWHGRHGCYDYGRFGARASTTPHLNYYGGPVISNVNIVMVLYGTGTYQSFLTSTRTPNMASFYQQIVTNHFVTGLSEYNTSAQTIGAGTYGGKYQITPAKSRDGSTITDSQIQAELKSQLQSGHLPAPNANTVYMIHFPQGKTIYQGGISYSCTVGGFCAYHGTIAYSGGYIYYGVLPDMGPKSGCYTGCGNSKIVFNNQTSVASHELGEAITDAAVGVAPTVGAPLAWYDPNNGEIGDICNGVQGTTVGGDGNTYTVQKLWSNAANACVIP